MFCKIALNKSKFLGNLPGKIEVFLPGSTIPQSSNQIDANGKSYVGRSFLTVLFKI